MEYERTGTIKDLAVIDRSKNVLCTFVDKDQYREYRYRVHGTGYMVQRDAATHRNNPKVWDMTFTKCTIIIFDVI